MQWSQLYTSLEHPLRLCLRCLPQVESASVGDGGCSCSADVKTDRAAAGAACSRCRKDVGEQLPRQQVVVMESHAAQIVLACLRSLEVRVDVIFSLHSAVQVRQLG